MPALCHSIGTTPVTKYRFSSLTRHSNTVAPPFLEALSRNAVQTRGFPCFHDIYRLLHLRNIRNIFCFEHRHPPTTTYSNNVRLSGILNIQSFLKIFSPPLSYTTTLHQQTAVYIFHRFLPSVLSLSHPFYLLPEHLVFLKILAQSTTSLGVSVPLSSSHHTPHLFSLLSIVGIGHH